MDEQARIARPQGAASQRAVAVPGMIDRPGSVRAHLPAPELGAEDDRPTWPAMRRGFLRRCPHCGEGRLFDGYLKVSDSCAACGEILRHHRADDGPAYLTILVVGHILGVVMHVVWVQFRPDPLVFATLLTVFAVGLSLWLLPRFKGAIVGFQWARRMHGFGGDHG
jgi:uncharacterized protein (DUF983 family)